MTITMLHPKTKEPTAMYTYAEAAEAFGVKMHWLRWHKHRGNLAPDAIVGQTPLFTWNTLYAFIKERAGGDKATA